MLFRLRRVLHLSILAFDLAIVAWGVVLANTVVPIHTWSDLIALARHPEVGLVIAAVAAAAAFWILMPMRGSVYQSRRTENLSSELWLLAKMLVVVTALVVLTAELFWERLPIAPGWLLIDAGALFVAQRFVVRTALRSVRRKGHNARSYLLVGFGPAAAKLRFMFDNHPEYGLRCAGLVPFEAEDLSGNGSVPPVCGSLADLESVLPASGANFVVLNPPKTARAQDVGRVFGACDNAGIPCTFSPPFSGLHLKPHVETYAGVPLLTFVPVGLDEISAGAKRLFDVVFAGLAMLLLSPVFAALALAIKLDSPGPVLFRQRRVGRFGQTFTCLKFRTMVADAESRRQELEDLNEEDGPAFKIHDDPRVTRVGQRLRKYSLDELPQLLNVLIGDMSMVGPRPPTPDEVDDYEWAWRRRLSVRPGLTCIWQVDGRNKVSFERWMAMDFSYIDRWSLWLDLKLVLRTVVMVFRGTGS